MQIHCIASIYIITKGIIKTQPMNLILINV